MSTQPWLHFWGLIGAPGEKAISRALAASGIELGMLDRLAPAGDGALCFSGFDNSLCRALRDISHNGAERILAISVAEAALGSAAAWQLLDAGASDVIDWRCDSDGAARVKARFERWRDVDRLVESSVVRETIVGASPVWRSTLRRIVEVARFTAVPVLLLGESGTGKELIARLIHDLDPRPAKAELAILDCTTVVPELSGSEFFGHERGAFTGAVQAREGAFGLADGGSLFLDEVGELPLGLQGQLLRVIQEGTYKPVGGNSWHRTAFRLVCATNRNLLQETEAGRFRSDLYYRIASWVFRVPPLRERREDILPLVRHFLDHLRPEGEALDLDSAVRDYLLNRSYPGNVRDLRQLVSRLYHRHVGPGPITLGDIPEDERPTERTSRHDWRDSHFERAIRHALALGFGLRDISNAAADTAVRIAMRDQDGSVRRAARQLGVTDRALQLRRAGHRVRDEP